MKFSFDTANIIEIPDYIYTNYLYQSKMHDLLGLFMVTVTFITGCFIVWTIKTVKTTSKLTIINHDYYVTYQRSNFFDIMLSMMMNVANRSESYSHKVGCVIINDRKEILSFGYNAFTKGIRKEKQEWEDKTKSEIEDVNNRFDKQLNKKSECSLITNDGLNKVELITSNAIEANYSDVVHAEMNAITHTTKVFAK